jgi:hypothetical protein
MASTIPNTKKASELISYFAKGRLNLRPPFQRNSVWKSGAKSYFIDTLVRGLPVPMIFLRVRTNLNDLEPEYEVVDGQQRLRTLISYVRPETLKDLQAGRDDFMVTKEHNPDLAGKTFGQLSNEHKHAILDYDFAVYQLPDEMDDRQVLDMFARLNSTGLKLNNQELRNAAYFGPLKQCMYRLSYAYLDRWLQWGIFTKDQIAAMADVEMASDCVRMMTHKSVTGSTKKQLDKFYYDYDKSFPHEGEVEDRFAAVMDFISEVITPTVPHTSRLRKRTFFYPLFATVYDVMYGVGSDLGSRRRPLSRKDRHSLRVALLNIDAPGAPEEVLKEEQRRTTHTKTRTILFEFVRGLYPDE